MRQYPQRSSSVARQIQGIKQTRNRKQCVIRQRMDEGARNRKKKYSIKKIGF